MEVFMHNLPSDLTEAGLNIQLEPFMKQLAIVDYLGEKPKKRRFGYITFLYQQDGEKFLAVHGQEDLPQGKFTHERSHAKARLVFMGAEIVCKISRRLPQGLALKTLAYAAEQRKKPAQEVQEEGCAISFKMLAFSCGLCTFVGDRLTFVPEVQWGDGGIVRVTKRNMVVKVDNNRLIRIPLNTIVELVWFRDGSLTLTLSTVPLFFSDISPIEKLMAGLLGINVTGNNYGNASEASRSRLCALGEKHAEVVGQCLVYQFNVSPVDLSRKIEDLKRREITITRYDLAIQRTAPIYMGEFAPQLKALMGELANYTKNNSLPFGVLFQLQALAYNAYLHPATVLGLTKQLHRIFRDDKAAGKTTISVDAMRKLFDMIDWPLPHGVATDFEVSSLVAAIKQNEQEIQEGVVQRDGLFGPTQTLVRVNRVMVTPTRITLHGPEMVPKNRILRKFPNHHEYLIRGQFCDESGQDLYFNPRVSYDEVYAKFKRVLKRGIQIAGRTYTFLGFSHSSLRSHSVWVSFVIEDVPGMHLGLPLILLLVLLAVHR
jgi:RNA dependent RNA polymerase